MYNNNWWNTSSGAYAIYDHDPANDALYGKLYNHFAVTDSRGLCTTGWHVPSDGEWTMLENFLGGSSVAGGALKSTSMHPVPGGWYSPNTGATNSSGFTAPPGGRRDTYGYFTNLTYIGIWWSSSQYYTGVAWNRFLGFNNSSLFRTYDNLTKGFSVRCLKNTLPQVNTNSVINVTPSTALITGEVISEGDQNTTWGFCYSINPNPTISNDTTMNGTGTGVYSDTLLNLTPLTTYYVRAYATNSVGTSYGSELSFTTDSLPVLRCPGTPTVTDIDGNVYNTVQIGSQCWTQSNLKTSRYRNGDNIPTGLSNGAWQNTTSGAYAIYNNDSVNDELYGKLYNHFAVTDSRGLCPTGWHVPSDGEWNVLVKHLDPNADTVCGGCSQSGIAGSALKSTLMQPTPGGWSPPNAGATNSSGLTSKAAGFRGGGDGSFYFVTWEGWWWSLTVSSGSYAWGRFLSSGNSDLYRSYSFSVSGLSVRCLKD